MSRTKQYALADGCFDPLHVGHVRYLQEASEQARPLELLVNIAPDAAIEAKGRKPFQTANERAATVRALGFVSEAVVGDLVNAIEIYRPAYLFKGSEWRGRLPADVVAACKRYNVVICYTDTQERTSTERLAS